MSEPHNPAEINTELVELGQESGVVEGFVPQPTTSSKGRTRFRITIIVVALLAIAILVSLVWSHVSSQHHKIAYESVPSNYHTVDQITFNEVLANPIPEEEARIGHTTLDTNVPVVGFRSDVLKEMADNDVNHRLVFPPVCFAYATTTQLRELGTYPGGVIAEIVDTSGPDGLKQHQVHCRGAVIEVGTDWSSWSHA